MTTINLFINHNKNKKKGDLQPGKSHLWTKFYCYLVYRKPVFSGLLFSNLGKSLQASQPQIPCSSPDGGLFLRECTATLNFLTEKGALNHLRRERTRNLCINRQFLVDYTRYTLYRCT